MIVANQKGNIMTTPRGRITKASKTNLQRADRAGIQAADGGEFFVWIEVNGHRAYLCSVNGPLTWTDRTKARRSIIELGRSDLADMSAV